MWTTLVDRSVRTTKFDSTTHGVAIIAHVAAARAPSDARRALVRETSVDVPTIVGDTSSFAWCPPGPAAPARVRLVRA